jgi:hypothetical protein
MRWTVSRAKSSAQTIAREAALALLRSAEVRAPRTDRYSLGVRAFPAFVRADRPFAERNVVWIRHDASTVHLARQLKCYSGLGREPASRAKEKLCSLPL